MVSHTLRPSSCSHLILIGQGERRVEGEASSQAGIWKGKNMAEKMRYNKIIDLLEHGKPVFSTSTVPNGSLDDLTYIADADYDAVIIEMEHEGFSFTTLRTSLQVLLNRKRIAEKGNLQPDVVPMVRIPPNARERNQWVIKQALDTGVYGSRFGTGVNASPLIDRPQNVKPPAGPV